MGITWQLYLQNSKAVRGVVGVTGSNADINADYIHIFENALRGSELSLNFFVGGGAHIRFSDSARFGVRVPVGLSTFFDSAGRFECYAELAPVLDFTPRFSVELNGGVGFRYYFM
jgi:hypothetical protein